MNIHDANAKSVTTQKKDVTEFSSIKNNEKDDKVSDCSLSDCIIVNKSNLNYARKAKLTKESVKRYRVIVKYVDIDDDEKKIKRAIIEDILKNS